MTRYLRHDDFTPISDRACRRHRPSFTTIVGGDDFRRPLHLQRISSEIPFWLKSCNRAGWLSNSSSAIGTFPLWRPRAGYRGSANMACQFGDFKMSKQQIHTYPRRSAMSRPPKMTSASRSPS
jgi:hypothetical protein